MYNYRHHHYYRLLTLLGELHLPISSKEVLRILTVHVRGVHQSTAAQGMGGGVAVIILCPSVTVVHRKLLDPAIKQLWGCKAVSPGSISPSLTTIVVSNPKGKQKSS